MANKHIGSAFDDSLKEDGIYEEVTATALKRGRARQAKQSKDDLSLELDEIKRSIAQLRLNLEEVASLLTVEIRQRAACVSAVAEHVGLITARIRALESFSDRATSASKIN